MAFWFQPVCLLLYIIAVFFYLPCFHAVNNRVEGLRQEVVQHPNRGLRLSWVEEGGEVHEGQPIPKVSGEDHGGRRMWVLQKVRAFLGFKNHGKEMSGHEEIGSSSAPAPMVGGGVAESPPPALPFFTHESPHHSALDPTFALPHQVNNASEKSQKRGCKLSARVISLFASTGGVFALSVMVFFGFVRFRGRKKKKQRAVRTMLLPGFCTGGTEKVEVSNPSNFVTKVAFDQGPEHFYLNTLVPSAKTPSDVKNQADNVNAPPKPKPHGSPGQGRINKSANRHRLSFDRNEILRRSKSAEEEMFHSICRSLSSNRRVSDASDGRPSLPSSPASLPRQHSPRRRPLSSPFRPSTPKDTLVSQWKLASSLSHVSAIPSEHATSPRPCNLQNELPSRRSSRAASPVRFQNAMPPPPPAPPGPPLPPRAPPPPLVPKGSAPPLVTQAEQSNHGNRLPKLKPLHWDKVRAASDRSMVWDKLRAGSFEFDEEMIETLFGYNLKNSARNEEARNRSSPPSKHVLDPKRLQNITILSKALNASPEQVCYALMQGDGLTIEQLEALARMVPTKEEEEKLLNYDGDVNELGLGERFVKEMLNLPLAFLRIEAMLYKETFEDEVLHLKKSFVTLEDACKELKSSRLFLKLLEAVLKTGNRMNDGTSRGGAKAFKLDALLKLADVKGTDGKTTLLHFVVQEMIRSEGVRTSEALDESTDDESRNELYEEREERYRRTGLEIVSRLSTELANVRKTACIDLDALSSSVSKLLEGSMRLKELIDDEHLLIHGKGDEFVKTMRLFLYHAEDEIEKLQQDKERVLHMVRRITEYFHGDMSKDDGDLIRIFVIVSDFLGMLDHVCKEIRSMKPSNTLQIPRPANFSVSVG
ncbi:formin-like protein 11 isoform X1 [Nymphaea colorata]|nr:formin-like protein 11 isoform X1 [Nymphaea colorata]